MTQHILLKSKWCTNNQEPEERLKEVVEELLEFQVKYKADTVKEALPIADGNKSDALADYYKWESLEEEFRI